MPRRNANAKATIRRGVARRGRHRSDHALFVRICEECGTYESSADPRLLADYRECPRCSA